MIAAAHRLQPLSLSTLRPRLTESSTGGKRTIAALRVDSRATKPRMIPTRLTAAVAKSAHAATPFALTSWLCGNAR